MVYCTLCLIQTLLVFEIRDLESNDVSLEQEATNWLTVPNDLTTQRTSICSETYLLGIRIHTSNSIFTRTYIDLPPHEVVSFSFIAWIINDEFQSEKFLNMSIDNSIFQGWNLSSPSLTPYLSRSQCGGSMLNNFNITIKGNFSHTNENLTLISSMQASITLSTISKLSTGLISEK